MPPFDRTPSTMIWRPTIARRTGAGTVASSSFDGSVTRVGAPVDVVAACAVAVADVLGAVSPTPPASSSARASCAAVASLAFSTALPARLSALAPPASTGRLEGAVGVAAAGVPASSLGRRNSIQAARRATTQTRRIRMGGEIWDIPLPLSAAHPSGLSRISARGVLTRSAGRLRERDHVADRVAARQQRDDPVDPERDPAVGRCAEAQRLEQEAEAR